VPVRRSALAALLVSLSVAFAACQPGSDGSLEPETQTPPTALTVGLGFIPSVQFAPFYLADREGYYREAGLEVTFQNRIDPDLVTLVGQGSIDVGLADGTTVIPAVSQGIPIRAVATIYGKFPSIVFAKATSGIRSPADLAGTKLGIPGRYGSSWVMLQALLDSAGLTPDDLEIVEYADFGQGVALQQDQVDAATGFVNNEPIALERTGEEAVILTVDEVVPLPGPGLITGTSTLEAKSEALSAFVGATLRAMEDIAADPEVGLDAATAAVPELASDAELQRAILEATIEAWQPTEPDRPVGSIDLDDWQASIDFMTELGLVPNEVTPQDVTDLSLLPQG
jgi:NitT/TauT family transport system substrate-binding protein